MGRIFVVELEERTYRCKFCKTHLAPPPIAFRGLFIATGEKRTSLTTYFPNKEASQDKKKRNGNESTVDIEDWLVGKAEVNITNGTLEERMMLSGVHTVTDTFCCFCGQIVGWKYETAHETAQKYKEGKFVLEGGRIVEEVDFSTEFDIDSED